MFGIDYIISKDCLISTESEKASENLQREKHKLEEMIIDVSENDGYNMGQNKRILMQSDVIDKLIVNEMMLSEMKEKLEAININK